MKRRGHQLTIILFEVICLLTSNKALSPSLVTRRKSFIVDCLCRRRFSDASNFALRRPRRRSTLIISFTNKNEYDLHGTNSSFSSSRGGDTSPFPNMPSRNFLALAQSQLDLLASTLQFTESSASGSKVQSMALYLPRENSNTGQLEFVPVVTWPLPERIWIASDALSKKPPSIPRTLTRLPGFTHAKSLLPRYPFAAHQELSSTSEDNSSSSATTSVSCGVGPVEDVRCQSIVRGSSHKNSAAENDNSLLGEVLSVALYRGSLTVGVLLIWPAVQSSSFDQQQQQQPVSFWSALNYKQISNAAYGLSIALSMDMEGSRQELSSTTPSSSQTAATTVANSVYNPTFPLPVSETGVPKTNSRLKQQFEDSGRNFAQGEMNNNLYAYTSAQAYRELVQAQLAQTENLRRELSDNLHQVKNPLQALRAFGKLLQRKLTLDEPLESSLSERGTNSLSSLRELADRMMIQTDRVIELLKPMEDLVYQLESSSSSSQQYLYLPAGSKGNSTRTIYYLSPVDNGKSKTMSAPQYLYLPGSTDNSIIKYDNNADSFYKDTSFLSMPATREQLSFAAPDVNDALPINISSSEGFLSGQIGNMPKYPTETASKSPRELIVPNVNIEMAFISDVIEPILSNAAVVAADRNITFEVTKFDEDDLPGVKICPSSLQEALSNVVENAIKYVVLGKEHGNNLNNNPSPHVRVSVTPIPDETTYRKGISIIVEDNGPGISKDERESVFQRGFRGSYAKNVPSGNGLGLDISRSMLSRFGGTLEVIENGPEHLNGTVMRIMIFR